MKFNLQIQDKFRLFIKEKNVDSNLVRMIVRVIDELEYECTIPEIKMDRSNIEFLWVEHGLSCQFVMVESIRGKVYGMVLREKDSNGYSSHTYNSIGVNILNTWLSRYYPKKDEKR